MTRNSGQSMVEVMLAFGVTALIVMGLVQVVTSSIATTGFSRQKAQATRLAVEAMEWYRGERDKDWGAFYGYAQARPGYCLESLRWDGAIPNEVNPIQCAQSIPNTGFFRWATLTAENDNSVEVVVEVWWIDGKGTHHSTEKSSFTNWKQI